MSPHSHHSLLDPATTNKVIQYYIKATNYDTNWHKVSVGVFRRRF